MGLCIDFVYKSLIFTIKDRRPPFQIANVAAQEIQNALLEQLNIEQ